VPVHAFNGAIEHLVFCTCQFHFLFTTEATEVTLGQRGRKLISATPHTLNKLVRNSVFVRTNASTLPKDGVWRIQPTTSRMKSVESAMRRASRARGCALGG